MSKHEHQWILVSNSIIEEIPKPGEIISGRAGMRLMRFCQTCEVRQMLSPDDLAKEQEEQLARARYVISTINQNMTDETVKDNYYLAMVRAYVKAFMEEYPE